MHDARIGRFLSIDPLAAKYPFWSPYAFSRNMVIQYRELEGLEPAMDGNEPGNYQVAGDQKNGGSFGWTWTGDDWRRGPEEVLMDESLPATKSKVKSKKSNFLGGIPLTTPKMNIDPAINRGVYSVTGGNNMQKATGILIGGGAAMGVGIGLALEALPLITFSEMAMGERLTSGVIEIGAQLLTNGFDFREIDVLDVGIGLTGMNLFAGSLLTSTFDYKPFGLDDQFSMLGYGKSPSQAILEFGGGYLGGKLSGAITGPGFNLYHGIDIGTLEKAGFTNFQMKWQYRSFFEAYTDFHQKMIVNKAILWNSSYFNE